MKRQNTDEMSTKHRVMGGTSPANQQWLTQHTFKSQVGKAIMLLCVYLQIQRVEEEDQVFALEISKAHLLELPVEDSSGLKIWSRLRDRKSVV